MHDHPDLGPAARRMNDVVAGIPDGKLSAPTPCTDTSVGDLLDHVMGLALGLRRAAEKTGSSADDPPPAPSAANLPSDWREVLARRLDDLATAWRAPEAWQGATEAGGVELSGQEAGIVALDELVLHGWDLARATGQSYACDPADAEACLAFVANVPEDPQAREGLFGPVVDVPEGAPLFDRLLALSGRDPSWAPA
ncbi:TIGR03086 family protein [Nocardiopsis gilva YIM 90087]|uniref:TIGR03086 family protein n=1 Tax=Nocardiopsis gilva YIM 90087 TaxID=1235441 RepID=A0A223S1H7_9ACTN|nr:TIGR03086 family metal-binding protein [Nocardiopsis gilva]ASU81954.1 TIGR03086 family protein [Nocardiopsis gilva YIM 90087]